jgi:hypothetical protein
VTFFRMPERPVSLSLALRTVAAHADTAFELENGPWQCFI